MKRSSTLRPLADYPPPTPQPTPCRIWQGALSHGYGRRPDGEAAHRWVWRMAEGSIPEGAEVMHRCDNPPCFRFEHLRLGVHADNMADMKAKQRATRGHPRKLTATDVLMIRASSASARVLAQELGVTVQTITDVRGNRTWKGQ